MKTKLSTIIRTIFLILAIVNQIFAVCANGAIEFASSMAYQIISVVITVIVGIICFWYNNDYTEAAKLTGKLFDSIKDGKMTISELSQVLSDLDRIDEKTDAKTE